MRWIVLIFALMMPVIATADDSLSLSKDSYTLKFEKISKVSSIEFSSSRTISVDGAATITEKDSVITIQGKNEVTPISVTFPEKIQFSVKNGATFNFKNQYFTMTAPNERDTIRFDENGLYINNDNSVVKITKEGVFVRDTGGDGVEISNKGTIVTSENDRVKLGFIGKLISYIVKKAVIHTVDSEKIITETLSSVAQDEELDLDVIGSDFNIRFNNTNINVDVGLKQEMKKFTGIKKAKIELISSDCEFVRSMDTTAVVKVNRPETLPKGYSFVVDKEGDTIIIKEKFEHNVKMRESPKFTVSLPADCSVDVTTASGDVSFLDTKTIQVTVRTASGNIAMESCTMRNSNFFTASGDISVTGGTANIITMNSASGDQHLENMDLIKMALISLSGNIQLLDIKGDEFTLRSVSGDLSIENSSGKMLNFENTSGDVIGNGCTFDELNGVTITGNASFSDSTIKKKKFKSQMGELDLSLNHERLDQTEG